MPTEVILPRVDMDMATGKISKWLVDDGAPVEKGQPLFEIETDKAAMEIEAEASGTIQTLARACSYVLAVGSVVAWIYREGESKAPAAAAPDAAPEALLRDGRTDAPPPPAAEAGADRLRATPLARRLARERGHDLAVLNGTGPRGRIQASDVPAEAAAAPAPKGTAVGTLRDGFNPVPPPAPATAPVHDAEDVTLRTPSLSPRSALSGSVTMLRDGEGTPIMLLHGFGSDTDGWRPFLQGYDGARPVLSLDLPGHGRTALGADADFVALVDAVETILLSSGVGAMNLVGHSLGGAVSAAVAARGALDLRSLLLLAPAGLGPEINGAFVEGFLGAMSEASLGPWLRELVADAGAITPAFVRASLKGREAVLPAQRRLANSLFPDGTQAFTIQAELARVACPVRVVFGDADRIIPARHARALPGVVAVHRLPSVGHLPHIEARQSVQTILAQTVRP